MGEKRPRKTKGVGWYTYIQACLRWNKSHPEDQIDISWAPVDDVPCSVSLNKHDRWSILCYYTLKISNTRNPSELDMKIVETEKTVFNQGENCSSEEFLESVVQILKDKINNIEYLKKYIQDFPSCDKWFKMELAKLHGLKLDEDAIFFQRYFIL